MLPTPPSDEEKISYLKSNGWIFYSFNTLSITGLLLGSWLFTVSHPAFYFYAVVGILSTIYLGLSLLVGLTGKDYKHTTQNSIPYGTIDIFLPCCGEDIEIIRNTHKYVANLAQKQHWVYVLDDKNDPEVKKSAELYGFHYLARPTNEHKKAGNLRYAFERSNGRFILILDADFVPREDMIQEMLPFFNDEKLGILQTPQFFRIQGNWIERGAAYVQEVFYRLIQVKRNSFDAAICVGTCAMYRREALTPFGGTALIDHSEDVHTGINVIAAGYKVKYIPLTLSAGVCPDNPRSFFNQQYRWAMGSISLFFHSETFWKAPLSIMQRLCYSTGLFYYLTTAIVIFLQPLPPILLLIYKPEIIHLYSFMFSLPSLIFGTIFMAWWTNAPFGSYALKIRTVSSYAHLFAWIDGIFGTKMEWIATGSKTKNSKYNTFLTILFWWNFIILSTLFFMVGYRFGLIGFLNLSPVIILSSLNYWQSTSGFFE